MRWYGPNNATLTVAGDVNPTKVLELANKYLENKQRRLTKTKKLVLELP